MSKSDRRLVPIVSIDVAGSTRLIERDERAALRLMGHLFDQTIGPAVTVHGGTVFKLMGDGLLAEFPSVVAAVECIAALQNFLAAQPLSAPGGETVQMRAAIVLGDVLVTEGDRYGVAVNMAVRMQAFAPPGGMAISKWMHEYLVGKLPLTFTDIGSHPLKNLSQSIHIFIWHPDPAVQRASAIQYATSGTGSAHGRPSLVVLPFANLSPEREDDYCADAVVDAITATLSRVGDFLVIARNSAFAYKGRAIDVRQIGRELGVRYVLEGSVQRAGERIRITAQLVEAATGAHIWVGKAEGTTADLFALQDRVAEIVAGNIYPSLRKAEIERARLKPPDNLEAYDLVMRALPHLWAHRMHENP
ncbi:MAG: adenylate/guanylate cyclase domain-containing protein, partial [Hyphomicrobiales bacterium]